MIPFNRASFAGNELSYLSDAIRNGHVSGNGPFTKRVEGVLGNVHGSGKSLLTTSCTHALEMTALLTQFESGDEVIVPSFTFVSSAAAFLLHGGKPVFVDVRPDTLNVDLNAVEAVITPRTRAICVVHYAGIAADPRQFRELAERNGLVLIEDNAHGLFASFEGRPLGTFGHVSTMSFHETKNVTCGEGGALHINDDQLFERAEILREKGTNRSRFFRGQVDKYTWVDVGSSWVLSDLLAGVLAGQFERHEEIQASRSRIWRFYDDSLSGWAKERGVRTPVIPEGCEHSSHMYHMRFMDLETRTRFIEHMKSKQVSTVFHYQPLHLSEVGRRLGGREGQCPVSEDAGDTLVRLPLFAALTDSEVDQVVDAVTSFAP
jgi:dTDP-4-amino-4,6-dideoxygalactose transaminase